MGKPYKNIIIRTVHHLDKRKETIKEKRLSRKDKQALKGARNHFTKKFGLNSKDKEFFSNKLKHKDIIVEKMIDYAINYEKYIDTIKNIFNILSDRNLLSSNNIKSGLDNILEFIDDIIIDSPNAKLTIDTLFKK